MKLSRALLCEYTEISLAEFGERAFAEAMTMSGSKVEGTEILNDRIKNVVVGKIAEMWRQPDTDHMWVCSVDVGAKRPLSILTGAQNQKIGDLVPVALDGAVLPGGKEIKSGLIHGALSEGMLCSIKELGLTLHEQPFADEGGLFIINEACKPGDDICTVIGLDDQVVEFEITPNRSDCLSVIGIAREAAATFDRPLKLHTPKVRGGAGNASDMVAVTIEEPLLCPRYTARVVKNVKIEPSPRWLRERLSASGLRPINNIVDITNYVMLEYGQPMHAFDLACVGGGHIIVRRAKAGETLQTLDGEPRVLQESMLCICDENIPIAVAGVMGGANSEIIADTAAVIFESANFDGTSVRRTAAALNMRTDASSRFEKGIDPNLTKIAVDRACELVEMLGAGEVLDGCVDAYPTPKEALRLPFSPEKINSIIGAAISEDFMKSALSRLGFEFEGDFVIVPTWRLDMNGSYPHNHLAEEVARIYGFDRIESTLMHGSSSVQGGYSREQKFEATLGGICRSAGFDEVISYSFFSPLSFDLIRLPADSPLRDCIKILNPLGEDSSCMRTTTLPTMLELLARNRNYRNENVRLYDFGRIYLKRDDGLADEPHVLTLGAFGNFDFYKLKGLIEALLKALRIEDIKYVPISDNPSYHPGRCAAVYASGNLLGIFGQVHPLVASNYGVSEALYAAELDFPSMLNNVGPEPTYVPLPAFPAMLRDIAVVCGEDISAAELTDCIRGAGGEYLVSCDIFDVYKGAHIPDGSKSVAFSLAFRSDSRTLTDELADKAVSEILLALKEKFGAYIR